MIVIPVKPFAEAKTRLAAVLPPPARAALAERLFAHVLRVARAEAPVLVVSRDAGVLALARRAGALALPETAEGHNPALAQALGLLGRDPVLILSSDLPLLTREDLRAMLAAATDVAIATDSAGQGTNALWLARADALAPRFGPGSRHAHAAAAAAAGLSCALVRREGLARDLDGPADLQNLPAAA